MARWKDQSTRQSVDIELDEFSGEQNLQCLINRGWLTEDEALAIVKRASARSDKNMPIFGLDPDDDEFKDAKHFIMLGQRDEALIHLERFLGRDFVGRLAQ